jgi:HD-GYP domain-containing protein (c-di-GMP phosphodiesterase class II)
MERNMEMPFVNNAAYRKAAPGDNFPETHADAHFEAELNSRAQGAILEFIKKDNFTRDSLLMLFEHDKKTFDHSVEVGNISAYIANKLEGKISKTEATDLIASSLLHDYGKLAIEQELLNKNNITPAEKAEIKEHALYSFEFIKPFNEAVAKIVVGHHEHQKDPYPREASVPVNYDLRTTDNRTLVLTRVLAMIDAYEAMVADRPGNPSKDIKYINSELEKQFRLPGDQEVIFLLLEYYYAQNKDQKIDAVSN